MRLPAQLPAGSVAPDFMAQDINGQSWHLYELLEQDKIVLLELSATWCSPCWAYHNGHALQEYYDAHGPDGDNSSRVFFVEGDPETDVNCLFGSPGCNGSTIGNWVAGTSYPYLDNAAIADSFQASYYPTIYMICPNKKVYQLGQLNAEQLWEKTSTCPVASGANNAGIFYHSVGTDIREVCQTLKVEPSFTLINLGSEALHSATIQLQWNNMVEQTLYWTGNLPLYGESLVSFDSLILDGEGMLKTTISTINDGMGDDDFSNNVHNESFATASTFYAPTIILKIKTDNYGLETYWELRDDQDNVLYMGGNKNVGPNGGGLFGNVMPGPGTYGNNTLITKNLHLPGNGCYSIRFVDAYGDGMCCNYGNGYYKLYSINNPTVPVISGGEFAEVDHRGFTVADPVATNTPFENSVRLDLYPNPAVEQIQIGLVAPRQALYSGRIVDALGQMMYQLPAPPSPNTGEQQWSVSLTDWAPGLYFLHLQIGDEHLCRKFVVGK
ncbi:MAG: T9SS type A sorting domain-containing protein [Saprospiraceae bacterium]|nr:T9SS type A sorting domain-containing protein [Lewinellaceae bacterium]